VTACDPAWTACGVAEAIRADCLSSVEAVERCLDRIRRVNPWLNAVVTVDAEGARQAARDADARRARGGACGPLHGVPITIKDSFETAGLRTVSGDRSFAQHVPVRDAPPVARLREAGAIVIGKTNLPALASGIQTDNAVLDARTTRGTRRGRRAAVRAGRRPRLPPGCRVSIWGATSAVRSAFRRISAASSA